MKITLHAIKGKPPVIAMTPENQAEICQLDKIKEQCAKLGFCHFLWADRGDHIVDGGLSILGQPGGELK